MLSVKEKKQIYLKYKQSVNMSRKQLETWWRNPCSNKASLNRDPIERNLRLLSKPFEAWTNKDFEEANKTISFISRMKKVKPGMNVSKKCPYSKRNISLKNWAYDTRKK